MCLCDATCVYVCVCVCVCLTSCVCIPPNTKDGVLMTVDELESTCIINAAFT